MLLYSCCACWSFGHLGVQPRLVKSWHDLEHHIARFHRLALRDLDRLEIPFLQGTDFDVVLRANLADILLGDDDLLGHGAGDHDPMVLLAGLFLFVLVERRQGEARKPDGKRSEGRRCAKNARNKISTFLDRDIDAPRGLVEHMARGNEVLIEPIVLFKSSSG